jgi:hypothetical protein
VVVARAASCCNGWVGVLAVAGRAGDRTIHRRTHGADGIGLSAACVGIIGNGQEEGEEISQKSNVELRKFETNVSGCRHCWVRVVPPTRREASVPSSSHHRAIIVPSSSP